MFAIVDCFYIALFSALEQTHCACMLFVVFINDIQFGKIFSYYFYFFFFNLCSSSLVMGVGAYMLSS